jgi:hypothetical protein
MDALAGTAAAPVSPARPLLAVAVAIGLGAATALGVLMVWLGFRPLAEAMATMSFWMKALYTAAIALAWAGAVASVARPGGRLGAAPVAWAAIFAVLALLAGAQMTRTPPGQMHAIWMGESWRVCSMRIVALAAPAFLFLALALRRLAPTRLTLAGAAAGALAGAVGATVYGLYCQETAPAFVLAWYSLGIASCAALGALLGRPLLRW